MKGKMMRVIIPLLPLLWTARQADAAAPSSSSPSSLVFLSLGDWGVAGDKLNTIAKQMGAEAEKSNASFALLLGDNFYENGVSSDDPQKDAQWKSTYRDVFTAPALQQMKFYVVRGNHDFHQSPDAEINYFKNRREGGEKGRWFFPGPYYLVSKTFCSVVPAADETISNSSTATNSSSNNNDSRRATGAATSSFSCEAGATAVSVDLVFIDTVMLAPKGTETQVRYPADRAQQAAAQMKWIDTTLNESTADYLFVVGHYPVFSIGEHGDTPELIDGLEPLLVKYQVDGYISGHDHTIQHLEKSGVSYVVNGNAVKDGTFDHSSRAGQTLFAQVRQSYMVHEVSVDAWKTTAISETGEVLYSFTQQGGRRLNNGVKPRTISIIVKGNSWSEKAARRRLIIILTASLSVAVVLLGLFVYRHQSRFSQFGHSRLPLDSWADADDFGLEMEEL